MKQSIESSVAQPRHAQSQSRLDRDRVAAVGALHLGDLEGLLDFATVDPFGIARSFDLPAYSVGHLNGAGIGRAGAIWIRVGNFLNSALGLRREALQVTDELFAVGTLENERPNRGRRTENWR
jgi:hypothetical protein